MTNFESRMQQIMLEQLQMSINNLAAIMLLRERRETGSITKEQEVEILDNLTSSLLSSFVSSTQK